MDVFRHRIKLEFFLLIPILISLFFNVYKKDVSPPGFNADEAAFGYNAYSILKTGADEYGQFLPLRLKSFGDYKMPLYSYLSVPFVAIFGLNEESTRGLNSFLAFLLPIVIYFLTKELFRNKTISLLASILISTCLGLQTIGRQAHEAYLATFILALATYFFITFIDRRNISSVICFFIAISLSLFAYQSSRLFAIYFFVASVIYFFKKSNSQYKIFMSAFAVILLLFAITDVIYKPARVQNLFLLSSPGLSLQINQLAGEGGSRFFYNKLALGTQQVITNQLQYFSPQFLAINGDANHRFGFLGMSPITPLEYIFLFVGVYYLFKNKEKFRLLLLTLLIVTPLTASLSWADLSLTRTLFLLVPVLIIAAYGIYQFACSLRQKKVAYFYLTVIFITECLFLFYSWDFYFNHYPRRAIVVQSWQAGYKQMADYVKANYISTNKFYISQKNGQPYIFMLFYLQYPPEKYQKQASLSSPDQYGFGQVNAFDKFDFNFKIPQKGENAIAIGMPDDFSGANIDMSKLKKITVNDQTMFEVYQP